MVVLRANKIKEIKGLPPNLQWLTLTSNNIEELPEEIGEKIFIVFMTDLIAQVNVQSFRNCFWRETN